MKAILGSDSVTVKEGFLVQLREQCRVNPVLLTVCVEKGARIVFAIVVLFFLYRI